MRTVRYKIPRRIYLLLFLLIDFPVLGFAQQTSPTLEILLQAGPSHTFLRGRELTDQASGDIRPVAGLALRYKLNRFFLQTGFLYENKGNKEESSNLVYDEQGHLQGEQLYTVRTHYHYLVMPLFIGKNVGQTGFYGNAGVYLAYLFKQQVSAFDEDLNLTPYTGRIDGGLSAGIGFSRSLSNTWRWSVEARHNWGLLDTNKEPILTGGTLKTTSTNLLLGISYAIK